MPNRDNLLNRVFGRWTILGAAGVDQRGKAMWLARCDCGTEKTVRGDQLKSGESKSCGCLHRELVAARGRKLLTKHGHAAGVGKKRSPTYRSWRAMLGRCYRPNASDYSFYGGRGITVCERWHSFDNFLADMGERPVGGTIDRIDQNGNYEPGNCRWATRKEQTNNFRRNHLVAVYGSAKTLSEWSEISGASSSVIRQRLKRGWAPKQAVFGRA